MGFNSAFKELIKVSLVAYRVKTNRLCYSEMHKRVFISTNYL